MGITDVAALVGAVAGPAGLLVAVLVYFRDRAVVSVGLQWDMSVVGDDETYFVVTIRNVGRRPIYLSHAHIRLPRDSDPNASLILLNEGLEGVTLAEGAPPHIVLTAQDHIEKHADVWWRLRATVIDAAGRHHHSEWATAAPSFAKDVRPPRGALAWNRARNWARRRLPW
jgi:hypothetical protein